MTTNKGGRPSNGRTNVTTIKINPVLKTACVRAASDAGEAFADFFERALVEQLKRERPDLYKSFRIDKAIDNPSGNPRPAWTRGLTDRSAEALVSFGFDGKVAVRRAVQQGLEPTQIPNIGIRNANEILDWLGV